MTNINMNKNSLFIAMAVLAMLLALLPRRAYACACNPVGTPTEELEGASAVFVGKVTEWQGFNFSRDLVQLAQTTFEVSQVWKGPALPTLTALNGICAYLFEIDQEYLVYAYSIDKVTLEDMVKVIQENENSRIENDLEDDNLATSSCSRTKPLAEAAEDLAALGEGTIPAAENPGPLSPLAAPSSPLRIDGSALPPNCALPLALIGMLGFFPIRARLKSRIRNQ